MREIYRPLYLLETRDRRHHLETAELIKYASNASLATKISYANDEFSRCASARRDVRMVAKAMGLAQRIGSNYSCAAGIARRIVLPAGHRQAMVKIAEQAVVDFRTCRAATRSTATAGTASAKLHKMSGTDCGPSVRVLARPGVQANTDAARSAGAHADPVAGGPAPPCVLRPGGDGAGPVAELRSRFVQQRLRAMQAVTRSWRHRGTNSGRWMQRVKQSRGSRSSCPPHCTSAVAFRGGVPLRLLRSVDLRGAPPERPVPRSPARRAKGRALQRIS